MYGMRKRNDGSHGVLVALALAAAGTALLARHTAAAMPAADLVFTNARVYTVDATMPWAQAVAIRNGRIDRDPSTGELVGGLQEAAKYLMTSHIPPPSVEETQGALLYATDHLHRLGICGRS